MFQRSWIILLGLLLLTTSVFALSIPVKPGNYINDYANLLSPGTTQNLDQQLQQFEKQTTNQIVVAIFPSLENGSLEDFTTRLEDQWKIGQTGKDNGILVVIFVKEHQVRIEVGYGLESVVPDALAGQIIQGSIVPNFKAENYDAGVSEAVSILMKVTRNADVRAANTKLAPDNTVYYTLGGILFVAAFIFFIRAFRRDKQVAMPITQTPVVQSAEVDPKNVTHKAQKIWFIYYIVTLLLALLGRGGGGGRGGNDFRGGGGRSGGGGGSGSW